ncbi:MAG: hypothetical protein AB7M05_05935 [Alphaproteobacteria bacterium]
MLKSLTRVAAPLFALLVLGACQQDEIRARGSQGGDIVRGNPAEVASCAAKSFDSQTCGFLTACPNSVVTVTEGGEKASVHSKVGTISVWIVDLAGRPGDVVEATYYLTSAAPTDTQGGIAAISRIIQACGKPVS